MRCTAHQLHAICNSGRTWGDLVNGTPGSLTFARVIHSPASFHAAVRSASQFWPRCELLPAGMWRTWTYNKGRMQGE